MTSGEMTAYNVFQAVKDNAKGTVTIATVPLVSNRCHADICCQPA